MIRCSLVRMKRAFVLLLVFLGVLVAWVAPAQAIPPANNNFAAAQTLSGPLPLSVAGDTTDATLETGEPKIDGEDGGHSVWYSWTAPSTGQYIFTLCGSADYDTLLGVFTGSAVNALSVVGENDDACPNNNSRVVANVTGGTTYRVAVDGYDAADYGPFTLKIVAPRSAIGGASIFWANYDTDTIYYASLDGSGGGKLNTSGATISDPWGVVVDPARNKVWWINYSIGSISSANLDGTGGGANLSTPGATFNLPYGLALDPVTGTLYWANSGNNTIGYARTDGSGGGALATTGATVASPCGVAVDRTSGRLWWANSGTSTIAYANLDGSGGGGALNTTGAAVSGPCGVAVNRTDNRVWWTNSSSGGISSASAGGGGGSNLSLSGAESEAYYGLVLDPPRGRVWWPDYDSDGLAYANLGGGGADFDPGTAELDAPSYPALLDEPSGTGAPSLSGSGEMGSPLSCAPGSWARDLAESFLFRAPRNTAISWTRDGQPVSGANGATLTPEQPGAYACVDTATNPAGSATQMSNAIAVEASNKFKIGKAKLNKKKGTAKLSVAVPGAGKLSLSGKGVKKAKATAGGAGTVKLAVKPAGKAKRKLAAAGKLKVKVKITFAPTGGTAKSSNAKVTLKLAG